MEMDVKLSLMEELKKDWALSCNLYGLDNWRKAPVVDVATVLSIVYQDWFVQSAHYGLTEKEFDSLFWRVFLRELGRIERRYQFGDTTTGTAFVAIKAAAVAEDGFNCLTWVEGNEPEVRLVDAQHGLEVVVTCF